MIGKFGLGLGLLMLAGCSPMTAYFISGGAAFSGIIGAALVLFTQVLNLPYLLMGMAG